MNHTIKQTNVSKKYEELIKLLQIKDIYNHLIDEIQPYSKLENDLKFINI